MELVTGRSGSPHITSQQDRQLHQGIFGDGAYILNTGNMLEPEVQSSNSIHIKDGALMFQGALFSVKVAPENYKCIRACSAVTLAGNDSRRLERSRYCTHKHGNLY